MKRSKQITFGICSTLSLFLLYSAWQHYNANRDMILGKLKRSFYITFYSAKMHSPTSDSSERLSSFTRLNKSILGYAPEGYEKLLEIGEGTPHHKTAMEEIFDLNLTVLTNPYENLEMRLEAFENIDDNISHHKKVRDEKTLDVIADAYLGILDEQGDNNMLNSLINSCYLSLTYHLFNSITYTTTDRKTMEARNQRILDRVKRDIFNTELSTERRTEATFHLLKMLMQLEYYERIGPLQDFFSGLSAAKDGEELRKKAFHRFKQRGEAEELSCLDDCYKQSRHDYSYGTNH